MQEARRMDKLQRAYNTCDKELRLFFGETSLLPQMIPQIPSWLKIRGQIQILRVLKRNLNIHDIIASNLR
jgi:hypothetical protein